MCYKNKTKKSCPPPQGSGNMFSKPVVFICFNKLRSSCFSFQLEFCGRKISQFSQIFPQKSSASLQNFNSFFFTIIQKNILPLSLWQNWCLDQFYNSKIVILKNYSREKKYERLERIKRIRFSQILSLSFGSKGDQKMLDEEKTQVVIQ